MLVKISKLDGDETLTSFPIGLHHLGRGPTLQCNDKRVSRNHASIEVTPDAVKLTSTHINPCFLKAANSKTLTILAKDSTTNLSDGDAFAFLPEDFWFKVKVSSENETLKRPANDHENAPPDKKSKHENESDDREGESSTKLEETEITETKEQPRESENKETGELDPPPEQVAEGKDEENVDASTGRENGEPDPTEDEAEPGEASAVPGAQAAAPSPQNAANASPGPSNPKPRKEKCWYGAQCYRKNPVHRQDYTHPGDSDYESDPNDDRPACPYGAQCYRRNKLHRRDYKHPPRQPPEKRNRKKVDRLNAATSQDMRELDDELEDPYRDDDDSDEYTGDSYEDDSDWEEDSQEVDEEQDNVKRLVKEANRFVKK